MRDSFIAASLVYTTGSILNDIRCRLISETKEKSLWNIPSKALAIGTGLVSTAASFWTLYTTHKISEKDY